MTKLLHLFFPCLLVFSISAGAQVSITNTSAPYTQDFNSLANTATASAVPAGWAFLETGAGGNTTYAADNGSANTGNTFSYGTTAATERAFGTLQSGSVASVIGVQFTNNSGSIITSLNITYTGEQWRLGTAGRPDKLDFQYSTDATTLATGTWTDEDNLDFVGPVTTGTAGPLDGNTAPNKTTITFNLTGLNIPGGASFWLRWNDFAATGADDGLGIDDFTINFNGTSISPCAEPANTATGLTLTPTATTISGSFTAASPTVDEYLVVRSTSNALSALPADATSYTAGQALGGGIVVSSGTAESFTDAGLTAGTTYYYFIFASNSDACTAGPNYLSTNSLNGSAVTLPVAACVTPGATATALQLTPSNNYILGSFTAAAGANRYLVVRSTASTLSVAPVNGTTYALNQALGNGIIVSYGNTVSFTASSLNVGTLYYFFVFSASGDCSGEPLYRTVSLNGSASTTNTSTGIPAGYYDAALGLTCAPLKTALFNITSSNTTQLSYTPGLWDAFKTTDVHRNDANTADIIWDIYTDNPTGPETYTFNQATNKCGSYTGEGDCYNREHSFPQAWFGPGTFPMYSDLHHVFPTDGWDNGKHDNNPFSEVGTATFTTSNGSKLGSNSFPGFTGTVFEPINEYKGDIARAVLYMVTRYQGDIVSWQNNGNANDILNGTTYPSLDDWYIKLLFKWHNLDPVSTKEINRNNAIYALQKNRNPFVDHPEYVALIFQCTGLLPVTIIDFKASKNNKDINLIWTASRETNFKNYEIERSTDGFNFLKIGVVAGRNLSNYTFTDDQLPNAKNVFYRLKMIDIDGKFSYSKIVSVRLNNNFSNAIVYPNPTTGPLTILLEKTLTAKSSLVVNDITGRKLIEQNVNAAQNTITVDVHHLPAGRYFVTIKNNTALIKESFVIIK